MVDRRTILAGMAALPLAGIAGPSFVSAQENAMPDTIPTRSGDLVIHPVDHASLVLEWDGKAIYVDPVGGAALYEDLPAP